MSKNYYHTVILKKQWDFYLNYSGDYLYDV